MDLSPTFLWTAFASILPPAAIAGWLAKPLLDFWRLRREVRQELIFRANIINAGTFIYDKDAMATLRRLGVKVGDVSPALLRWGLTQAGFDLAWAGGNLIGLSNALAQPDLDRDWRILNTHEIQVGLKLPRSYADEFISTLKYKRATFYPRAPTAVATGRRIPQILSRLARVSSQVANLVKDRFNL
jgi:hypothetical protein